MAGKKKKDKIGDALMKVALGCRVEEVTEEYAEVDGKMRLTKRKEIKKDIPPDLKAVQMLLAEGGGEIEPAAMSDEELAAERERLIAELIKAQTKAEGKEKQSAENKKTESKNKKTDGRKTK